MAVAALADQMEKPFIAYMEVFLPILLQGLANNEEYQVRRSFFNPAVVSIVVFQGNGKTLFHSDARCKFDHSEFNILVINVVLARNHDPSCDPQPPDMNLNSQLYWQVPHIQCANPSPPPPPPPLPKSNT